MNQRRALKFGAAFKFVDSDTFASIISVAQ